MSPIRIDYAAARTGAGGFVDAWTAAGGTAAVVADEQLLASLERWCGTTRVLAGPHFGDLPAALRWPCPIADAATAESAVVEATCAVAQTGSIVVDAARNGGRALSLLPARVAFVVRADSIVDTPADVLRHRRRWWPQGLPSQIVFISGPSRSADIEMTLTIGVHGPGDVHAIVVTG